MDSDGIRSVVARQLEPPSVDFHIPPSLQAT
jgi:hypothetical protein